MTPERQILIGAHLVLASLAGLLCAGLCRAHYHSQPKVAKPVAVEKQTNRKGHPTTL